MSGWNTIKGYAAGLIALVACPCHPPITLPLLAGLTARTAFGLWLTENTFLVARFSSIVFLFGLLLAFRWLVREDAPEQPAVSGEPIRVTLLTSDSCPACERAKATWQAVAKDHEFRFEIVDIRSRRGRALAARHNIFRTPTSLINDRVVFRSVLRPDRAAAALKR